MDVRTTFLHGDLKETIYIQQLKGFVKGNVSLICYHKKLIYGLKHFQGSSMFSLTILLKILILKDAYKIKTYFLRNL